MKNKTKRILLIILIIFIILPLAVSPFAGGIMYLFSFNYVNRPDYSITPGLVCYEEVQNDISRQVMTYSSKDNELTGYFYQNENIDDLIVVSHGMNDGADSLLSVCKYFYDNGYSVFTYDNSGCFDSKGNVNGYCQPLIDLKYTLDYLNTHELLKNSKKYLFGFSAGGFASSSVLSFNQKNIIASVSISAFNDASSLLIDKGKSYVGPIVYTGKWLVDIIQKNKFGEYLNYTAIDGINNANIPVLVAHGKEDKTIRYDVDSIICKEKQITNDNYVSYSIDSATHTSILYSKEAIAYQKEVNDTLKKIKNKEEKQIYVNQVDDYKYSQLNNTLFESILSFYKALSNY